MKWNETVNANWKRASSKASNWSNIRLISGWDNGSGREAAGLPRRPRDRISPGKDGSAAGRSGPGAIRCALIDLRVHEAPLLGLVEELARDQHALEDPDRRH